MNKRKSFVIIILLIVVSAIVIFTHIKALNITYLKFSDAAKFADIARSLLEGNGYKSNFNFFSSFSSNDSIGTARWIPPLMPISIAVNFLFFGVSDMAVIATSSFYFTLLIIFTYLLANRFYGKTAGILSAMAVLFNLQLIDYATSGASEPLFILQISVATYLISSKNKVHDVASLFVIVLMYLTRPQAPIYIVLLAFYYLYVNYKNRRKLYKFIAAFLITGIIVEIIFQKFDGRYFLQSVLQRGSIATLNSSSLAEGNTALRGGLDNTSIQFSSYISIIFKKVFYNIYNVYKQLPQILNPYLFTLFLIALIKKSNPEANKFKHLVILTVVSTVFFTAVTIPFYRYIHPVIPLVYIVAVGALVVIIRESIKTGLKIFNTTITKKLLVAAVSLILVVFFSVGQTIGVIFLDSRFINDYANEDKPPIYVHLSRNLKTITDPDVLVLTNLDTWGSWYGERKTTWYPIEPSQIFDEHGNTPFDAIYLTNYRIDDSNYHMGEEWREIFYNFNNPQIECAACDLIRKKYELKEAVVVTASETYENQEGYAILLVRRAY